MYTRVAQTIMAYLQDIHIYHQQLNFFRGSRPCQGKISIQFSTITIRYGEGYYYVWVCGEGEIIEEKSRLYVAYFKRSLLLLWGKVLKFYLV